MPDTIDLQRETKICESCGGEFGCGARFDGCWCIDLQIPAEVADGLKVKYQDCLCL